MRSAVDPWVVEAHADIDSTQKRMRERIRKGEDVHGHVVRAQRQLAGSGTRGRSWASDEGGSYQTFAVRADRPLRIDSQEGAAERIEPSGSRSLTAPGVSVAVGIGLASSLTDHGARAMVKWPNDLYYRDRKLGGILCESFQGHLMIGVGMNVANRPPPGGIALEGWDLPAVHELVAAGVTTGLGLWTRGERLGDRFAPFDWLAGREVEVRAGGRSVRGVAAGVTEHGALRVDGEPVVDGTVTWIGPMLTI